MECSKLCCVDCFTDATLKLHIKKNSSGKGWCNFCKKKSEHCIEPSELEELFVPIVNLYSSIETFMPMEMLKEYEGQNLAEKLSEDWEIFTNDFYENVEGILHAIFANQDTFEEYGINLDCWVESEDMFMPDEYNPSEKMKIKWNLFSKEIKNKNRFFPQQPLDLDFLDGIPILINHIQKNQYLYRARKSLKKQKIAPKNMGKPPAKKSIAGRANPQGIPYLYLANDRQTAIHEVRPSTTEFVTIGKFKILDELQIFDLSNPRISDPFLCGNDLGHTIDLLSFFRLLGYELSKPIDPKMTSLEYIPTQYLCEFIKQKGYDGISYKSTLGTGENIALFNTKKIKCTRSILFSIDAQPKKVQ